MKIKYLCNCDRGNTWSSEEKEHLKLIRIRDGLLASQKWSRLVNNETDGCIDVENSETKEIRKEWKHHDYFELLNEWLSPSEMEELKSLGLKVKKTEIVCVEADNSFPKKLVMGVFIFWNIIGAVIVVLKYIIGE